jgi:hypothetical protein
MCRNSIGWLTITLTLTFSLNTEYTKKFNDNKNARSAFQDSKSKIQDFTEHENHKTVQR